MSPLEGRIAIVTGSGDGLGRSHALRLAELGASVVVNDLVRPDGSSAAEEVVQQIEAGGGHAVAETGSVAEWDLGGRLVQRAIDAFGGLDVLVCNAGITRDRTLVNITEEEWDAVVAVHLKGHMGPLKHAGEYWRAESKAGRARQGAVVMTTSTSGLRGNPGQSNYASAKAAIASLTLVAARELARYGVRVNAIAPVARTAMTMAVPVMVEKMTHQGGFDRFDPVHVSNVVAWLSQESCVASGQVLTVFGGRIGVEAGWHETQVFERSNEWGIDDLNEALAVLPEGPGTFDSILA